MDTAYRHEEMKYTTSCPKCETQFLLNDELIAAHRGKVQCGTCELVFNAKTRLTEVADDINSPNEYQTNLDDIQSLQTEDNETGELLIEDYTNVEVEPEPTITTPKINEPSIFDDLNNNTSKPNKIVKHPVLLGVFGLLLLLMAATQTIYHARVKIAAQYPQFKPLLVKACSHLNCTVGLPKDLDSITIGDSDMQENDSYRSVINFTSSLTNTAIYPQAYPSIVLTLTNENDHIVIKKLISPEDYLPADRKVQDGIPGRGVSTIKLEIYVHEAVVAGYRILLIYP